MSKLNGYESEIKEGKILSIQMNLLNRCPSHCKSCRKYTWPDDILPFEDVTHVLKYLKDQGCTSVFFSGGDPLYYPRFSEVIDFCNSINLSYSVITTLICKDKALLEKIARTAYRIHVSMDAVDRETYKFIRGVDGFVTATEAIDYINSIRDESKIPIRFSSTIGVYNYNKVFEIYKFANEHRCIVNYYYIQLWGNLQMTKANEREFYEQIEAVAISEKEEKKVITNAIDSLNRRYRFDSLEDCKECFIPQISAIINCDGSIYPCCRLFAEFKPDYSDCLQYAYGNVINKTDEELEAEFQKRFMHYPLTCSECQECIKCDVRYNNTNKDIERIINGHKNPLFI